MRLGRKEFMERHANDFAVQGRSNRLKSQNSLSSERFADTNRPESLHRLDRIADVRRLVVARGKLLIANPNYPDRRIIRKISAVLARHLK